MDYEKLKDVRNNSNPFGQFLNIRITDIKKGVATAEMPVSSEHLNPAGSVHGGCLFTLADIVGGAAASSYGIHIATADSSFYFLRAGLSVTRLIGKAKEIKHGKRLLVYNVTIYNDQNQLLAEGIFTYTPLGMPITLP